MPPPPRVDSAKRAAWLARADGVLFPLERGLNLAAGVLVLFVVLFSVINIVGRGLFNKPFNAYFDLMGQSVPLVAFLGLSYCQRLGGHIRMDALVQKLRGRWLWFFELLGALLAFIVVAALAWGAYLHAARSYQLGDSTEDIQLILWPIKGALAVLFCLLLIRLALQICDCGRLLFSNGEQRPLTFPPLENAAQQAGRAVASEAPE